MTDSKSTRVLRFAGEIGGIRRAFVLEPGTAELGSSVDADVHVPEASVSRRHALLKIHKKHVEVEDLGSTNGTKINGSQTARGRLAPGDWLEVGAVALYLEEIPVDETRVAIKVDGLPTERPTIENDASTELMVGAAGQPVTPEPADSLEMPPGHVESRSPVTRTMYGQIRAAARDAAPVLVLGETGAGKEHVVRILHASSDRAEGPLRTVNCAAIPTDLLEAELFGIEAGVATGVDARPGALQLADGGTLFFDEIGDMATALQAKLLRALEQGEVQAVGARHPEKIDVRIVAATNTDLEAAVRKQRFRADLFYRLAGHVIEVPPLRKRRDDIPNLVEHFLRRAVTESGSGPAGISIAALQTLQDHHWPGNIRQLGNEIRRLVSTAGPGAIIERRHLGAALQRPSDSSANEDSVVGDLNLKRQVEKLERRLVIRAVRLADGNLADAARRLGLSRNGLVMKMQRLRIQRD